MTRPRRRYLVTAAVTLLTVVGGGGLWWSRTDADTSVSAAAGRETFYIVERRPYRAVVTLDARVVDTPPVAVARRRPNADVEWSRRSGDRVRAGQPVGWEVPAAAVPAGDRSDARDDLQRALRQRARLQESTALDIADAEADVEQSAPADRPRAKRALARLRLSSAQALDDLNGQIDDLRRVAPRARDGRIPIRAPVDGVLSIPPSGAEAIVQPTGHVLTAPVEPLVLYRLLDDAGRPVAGATSVKLTGTTIQFTCAALELRAGSAPAAPAGADPADQAGNATGAAATAVCRVPEGPRVFTGLEATLAITVTDLPEALVVDAGGVRAVDGDKGLVTVRRPDGSDVDRTVTLGPTDGLSVVITDGLDEGDRILDPAAGY